MNADFVAARILYLIDSLSPGGVARQLTLCAAHLPRADFAVRVVTLQSADRGQGGPFAAELRAAGIAVDDCAGSWPIDPRALSRLKQLCKTWRPDVVHSWDGLASGYAHLVRGSVGCVHIVSRRTWTPQYALTNWADRRVLRGATAVLTSSLVLGDWLRRQGVPSEKLQVFPSSVRPAATISTTRAQLLDELGLPGQARLMGCIGRLTVDKRIKDVIWAADLLKVIRDDVHLLIVGDGPHRARLETFRDQVRIADKVHFLGLRSDVPRLLAHCDVLLAAGQTDFQSSSILEAMAAGVPVVASDTAAHRELIEHDVTGDLVPVGDRGALTRQAMRVLDDAAVAQRLASAARAHAEQNFSATQTAQRLAQVYRNALAQR